MSALRECISPVHIGLKSQLQKLFFYGPLRKKGSLSSEDPRIYSGTLMINAAICGKQLGFEELQRVAHHVLFAEIF